jgi:hypothetical protein
VVAERGQEFEVHRRNSVGRLFERSTRITSIGPEYAF